LSEHNAYWAPHSGVNGYLAVFAQIAATAIDSRGAATIVEEYGAADEKRSTTDSAADVNKIVEVMANRRA
jgi:hypothetical protein